MAGKLQVWGIAIVTGGRQRRAIVAAPSRKAAAELLGVRDRVLKTYGYQSRNDEEISVALSQPGTVFATESMNYPHVYKALKPDAVKR